jgi:hypothetical protein
VKPPLHYEATVRVENAGGGTPLQDVNVGAISAAEYDVVANPGSVTVTRWNATSDAIYAQLAAPWTFSGITESISPLYCRSVRPRRPQHAPEDWSPMTYTIASPVSVLLSTNNWSKTGSIALSGTGNKTWAVTGAGTVSRTLKATYDGSDSYTTTKHAAGEDVWGWSLYSYLDVSITADVAATLTMTVYYVTSNDFLTTAARTYDVTTINGTTTVRTDLLFPNEGGPDYWERVLKIEFTGFSNGNYTLNSLSLVAVEDAYVKLMAQGSAATSPESGLVVSQDGSFPAYFWGPNASGDKDEETGDDGTGAGTHSLNGGCVKMNSTITALATEWARMEGITTTYDGSVIAADLVTDAYGTTIALTVSARWLHLALLRAGRAPANAAQTLYASLPIDQVTLVPAPAGTFILPWVQHVGMMLEGLCVDGSGDRAAAGKTMIARRSATGTPAAGDVAIGSGVTDASGYVSVPIPTGLVSASQFYTYLEGF